MNAEVKAKYRGVFSEILEVPKRFDLLSSLELAELRKYLSIEYTFLIQKGISEWYEKKPNAKPPTLRNLNVMDENYNHHSLYKHYILKIDKVFRSEYLEKFNAAIFLNEESQKLFLYIIDNWLIKESKKNLIQFVFLKFWIDGKEYLTELHKHSAPFENHRITCTYGFFVDWWNKYWYFQYPKGTRKKILLPKKLKKVEQMGYASCDNWNLKLEHLLTQFNSQF